MTRASGTQRRHRRTAWLPVLGLLLLSPVCAEYLVGYDMTIGDPAALLQGLLVLGPLYGGPALLLREIARRAGGGWGAILLLATAYGLVQAGLIDQSLFGLEFSADTPAWAEGRAGTPIPGTGVDADHLLSFVGGHVIWSFAAPIAVVEAITGRRGAEPWLGGVAAGLLLVLYALAAAFIWSDVASGAAPAQLAVTVLLALALAAMAVLLPRSLRSGSTAETAGGSKRTPASSRRPDAVEYELSHERGERHDGALAPSPWLVGPAAAALLLITQVLSGTGGWIGVAVVAAALIALGLLIIRWSRRAGWGQAQILALAGAALLVRAGLSFAVEPLGSVDLGTKYATNASLLLLTLLLLAISAVRVRRARRLDRPPPRAEQSCTTHGGWTSR